MNQSEKIRKLYYEGNNFSKISKKLNIRYQTVWRTLHRSYKGEVPVEKVNNSHPK